MVRKTKTIEDGNLHEFGFGNINPQTVHQDSTVLPVEMVFHNGPTMCVDKMSMSNDMIGNKMFCALERYGSAQRHIRSNQWFHGNEDPTAASTTTPKTSWGSLCQWIPPLFPAPSAGFVSNTGDIFNKNIWLNKCEGPNQGMLWDNKCYVTFVDNTRGFTYIHTKRTASAGDNTTTEFGYSPEKTKFAVRHIKEFKVTVIVRLCYIKLEAELINWMLQMNAGWLKNLGFKFHYPAESTAVKFRDLSENEPVNPLTGEAEEEESYIRIDCTGRAHRTDSSTHPMALAFHEREGTSVSAKVAATQPRPRTTKAAPKRKKL